MTIESSDKPADLVVQFVDLHLDDDEIIKGDETGLIESINDSLKLCYEIAQLTQNKEIYISYNQSKLNNWLSNKIN